MARGGGPGRDGGMPGPMTSRQWGLLAALSLVWGASFFLAAVSLRGFPPFTIVLGAWRSPRRRWRSPAGSPGSACRAGGRNGRPAQGWGC
jgi:hypothetical protein